MHDDQKKCALKLQNYGNSSIILDPVNHIKIHMRTRK